MSLKLGEIAPDFTQESTAGPVHFYPWSGNSWVVLFSHPKDFTPVCTTELGTVAKLKGEFDKRNVKAIGLSVDAVNDHKTLPRRKGRSSTSRSSPIPTGRSQISMG